LTGWGVRIAIIAIIAAGALIFRDRLTGNAGELKVGDCFDEPTTAETTIKDVQHHPCNEAHTAEVVFIGDHPAPAGAAVITEEDLGQFLRDTCAPAFNAYTGTDIFADETWDLRPFWPVDDRWKAGDREVTCYAVRVDGATMNTSIKKAP
jgi:hypothetical protein